MRIKIIASSTQGVGRREGSIALGRFKINSNTFRPFSSATEHSVEENATISNAQLRKVFFSSAAPMVGFGFMDNFVMIQAGGAIDATFGVRFGLATMTAAALGQVVSDVSGVLFGGVVERLLAKIGIHAPNLTPAQRRLARCRNTSTAGAVLGVITGCLLGAFPLLLDDMDAGEKKRRMDEMSDTLDSMIHSTVSDNENDNNTGNVIGAQHVAVHLCRDHERKLCFAELDTKCFSSQSAAIAVQCLEKKCIIRVDSSEDNKSPAILCAPVYSKKQQRVVAILEFVGKLSKDDTGSSKSSSFTFEDERLVKMLCQHMGIVIEKMH